MAEAKKNPAASSAQGGSAPRAPRTYYRKPRTAKEKKPAAPAPQLHIYPLGGLGEVGKNMTLYECG